MQRQLEHPWAIQRQMNQIFFANKFMATRLDFQAGNGWVLPLVYGYLHQLEVLEKTKYQYPYKLTKRQENPIVENVAQKTNRRTIKRLKPTKKESSKSD